jgi:hypothetical protein
MVVSIHNFVLCSIIHRNDNLIAFVRNKHLANSANFLNKCVSYYHMLMPSVSDT